MNDDDGRADFERAIYRLLAFVLVTALYAAVLRCGWGWHVTPSTGLAAPGLGNCLGIVLLLRLALLRAQDDTRTGAGFNSRLSLHVVQLVMFAGAMYLAAWVPF